MMGDMTARTLPQGDLSEQQVETLLDAANSGKPARWWGR
jgi:hypothetical protein